MKTRFTKAAEERQAALDYIIANPGASGPDVVTAMGLHKTANSKSMGADRLRDMENYGEVSRSPVTITIINKQGFPAKLRTYAYTALKTKTRTEDDAKKRMIANLDRTKEAATTEPEVVERWVRDPNRKPIRNQGGQGNCRHEVRRGCSLS